MDFLPVLLSIAVVQLLAAASPGPTFVIVSSYSISGRRRHGLSVVSGVLVADLIWALSAATGLGVVIAQFPAIYTALQMAGAAYLIWIGVKMLRSVMRKPPGANATSSARTISPWHAIRAGFWTNMVNPKSIAYYSSIFVVVFPPEPPVWLFAAAVVTALAVSAIWWMSVALFFTIRPIRRAYECARRGIDAVMGGVLLCLGIRMALSR